MALNGVAAAAAAHDAPQHVRRLEELWPGLVVWKDPHSKTSDRCAARLVDSIRILYELKLAEAGLLFPELPPVLYLHEREMVLTPLAVILTVPLANRRVMEMLHLLEPCTLSNAVNVAFEVRRARAAHTKADSDTDE